MISLKNVNKVFKSKNGDVFALKNINLNIENGDIFGIIGYSGAGKSTLIRCINFLERPTSGEVVINDVKLNYLSKKELRVFRRKIGMIFQHFNLMKNIDVFDNIALPLKARGYKKSEIEKKVTDLLQMVSLSDKIHSFPRELSGGQMQRVAIARALSDNPEILLCDEATSALDPDTTKSVLKLLKEIHEKTGITIVIITHQMEVVKQICTHVAVMDSGEIAEKGDIAKIFSNPKTEIAKKFVSGTMHDDEFLDKIQDENRVIYKISFTGKTTHTPLISEVVKNCAVLVNILFGNIEKISETMIGSLYVEILGTDENIKKAVEYIKNTGTKIEVIQHD